MPIKSPELKSPIIIFILDVNTIIGINFSICKNVFFIFILKFIISIIFIIVIIPNKK